MSKNYYKPVALFLVATYFGYQLAPILFGLYELESRAIVSIIFGLGSLMFVGDKIFKWFK